uniref:VQ domain-containing protein n=1 Tax=Opuntia streptacantha TaxID=393608 RepID=A0A7C9DPP8_OPUST
MMPSRKKLSKSSLSSPSANNNLVREPMKVVYIQTQYVETDAVSFKSVVQNLTGKDSTAGAPPPPAAEHAARREKIKDSKQQCLGAESQQQSLLTRDLSAREFDRMLKELPAFDELQKLLSFDS